MIVIFAVVVCVASIGGYIAGFVMGRDLRLHEAYELYKKMEEERGNV